MSELALKLIEEARKTKAPSLDLSNCGMTEIPPQLTELFWLKKLVIAGNGYYDLEKKQPVHTANKGTANHFFRLPKNFKNLAELTTLVISGEWDQKLSLTDITPVEHLPNLLYLTINYADISSIKSLQSLGKLQWLSFVNSQVISLEPLKGLSSLHTLYFDENQITSLKSLIALPALHFFSCQGCPINDCPADVYETGNVELLKAHYEGQKKSENIARVEAFQNPALPSEDTRRDVKLIVLSE